MLTLKIIIQLNSENFKSTKKITNNFFSAHAYNFFHYLSKLKSNFDYLEVGSYEGNSAIFVSKNFKFSNIYCVDNWEITEEYIGRSALDEGGAFLPHNTLLTVLSGYGIITLYHMAIYIYIYKWHACPGSYTMY